MAFHIGGFIDMENDRETALMRLQITLDEVVGAFVDDGMDDDDIRERVEESIERAQEDRDS